MFKQNLKFKLLAVALGLSVLTACDSDAPAEVTAPVAPQQQQQVAPPASTTAIFLPGGGGLDFGMKPVIDKSGNNKGKLFKSLRFDFEQTPEAVEQSIAQVLENQKYKKSIKENNNVIYNSIYRKEKFNPVEVQITEVVKEGFSKKTRVLFWWYEQ